MAGEDGALSGNGVIPEKSEIRNTKQIRIPNDKNFKHGSLKQIPGFAVGQIGRLGLLNIRI